MKKNRRPAIKEFKNLEIIEVATDADPQISLQARRTYRNGVFFVLSLRNSTNDVSKKETAEIATFLTSEQTKNFIKQLTNLSTRIENINKIKTD